METELEEKLGAILSDPNMLQKIQALAQSLSQPSAPDPKTDSRPGPEPDLGMLQKLSGLAQQTGIDKNQNALLSALAPYIGRNKQAKLEKAMRAARMAQLASGFLGNGGSALFHGR